ncbi:MAG: hypothetical protein O3C40_27645 [Planctomycetota bacterium]|nr:hypothetical protein [Planctomycetota bacterium]
MNGTLGSCLLAVCVLGINLMGCGRSTDVATDKASQTVYVDSKTMQAMVGPTVAETPALNPKTGERTLMPALYCPTCRRWHLVPSPDQINRLPGATKCHTTGAALTADGPWPE